MIVFGRASTSPIPPPLFPQGLKRYTWCMSAVPLGCVNCIPKQFNGAVRLGEMPAIHGGKKALLFHGADKTIIESLETKEIMLRNNL